MPNPKVSIYSENQPTLEALRVSLGLDSTTAAVNYLIRTYGAKAASDYVAFMNQIGTPSAPSSIPQVPPSTLQGTLSSSSCIQEIPTGVYEAPPVSLKPPETPYEGAEKTPRRGNRLNQL